MAKKISKKLKTIAENVNKVYSSGYTGGYAVGYNEGYDSGMVDAPANEENALMKSIIDRTISGEFTTPSWLKFDSQALAGSYITKLIVTADTKLGNRGYPFARMTVLTEVDWYRETYLLGGAFAWCTNLETLRIHGKYQRNIGNDFVYSCTELKNFLFMEGVTLELTNNSSSVTGNTKLTVESLLSILNALKDHTGGTQYTLKLGATNLAKLTEEQKAIATNKNVALA